MEAWPFILWISEELWRGTETLKGVTEFRRDEGVTYVCSLSGEVFFHFLDLDTTSGKV